MNACGHNNQRFVNRTLWIPKEISKTIQGTHVMWKENLKLDRIGKDKRIWITLVRIHSTSTQNDSQSTSLPPLIWSYFLKCPHFPVMYITIYHFSIVLLNHTFRDVNKSICSITCSISTWFSPIQTRIWYCINSLVTVKTRLISKWCIPDSLDKTRWELASWANLKLDQIVRPAR
jgi:hypothetical protein